MIELHAHLFDSNFDVEISKNVQMNRNRFEFDCFRQTIIISMYTVVVMIHASDFIFGIHTFCQQVIHTSND